MGCGIFFFFKQKTAYEMGRSPPIPPLSFPPYGGSSMARSTQKTSTDRPNLTAAATAGASKRNRNGLPWKRYFTRPGVAPFDEVQWETREAVITNEKGEAVFEQHDVEIPTSWSRVAARPPGPSPS